MKFYEICEDINGEEHTVDVCYSIEEAEEYIDEAYYENELCYYWKEVEELEV